MKPNPERHVGEVPEHKVNSRHSIEAIAKAVDVRPEKIREPKWEAKSGGLVEKLKSGTTPEAIKRDEWKRKNTPNKTSFWLQVTAWQLAFLAADVVIFGGIGAGIYYGVPLLAAKYLGVSIAEATLPTFLTMCFTYLPLVLVAHVAEKIKPFSWGQDWVVDKYDRRGVSIPNGHYW